MRLFRLDHSRLHSLQQQLTSANNGVIFLGWTDVDVDTFNPLPEAERKLQFAVLKSVRPHPSCIVSKFVITVLHLLFPSTEIASITIDIHSLIKIHQLNKVSSSDSQRWCH